MMANNLNWGSSRARRQEWMGSIAYDTLYLLIARLSLSDTIIYTLQPSDRMHRPQKWKIDRFARL